MNNNKLFLSFAIILVACTITVAQDQPKKPKAVKAAEKVNQKSQEINNASNEVVNQTQQTANNVKNVVNNAKTIIKIFEPILRLRLKKQAATTTDVPTVTNTPTQPVTEPIPDYNNPAVYVSQSDINKGVPIVAESNLYNVDGTANLGSQNHKEFGCYIDIMNGAILDEVDAAGQSKSIDLIFTATNAFNEQVPMYAFLSPAYVKNDAFAYNFFKGTKYKDRNIPPASWEAVNESEIAMTSLTAAQFEKIQDNNQLSAVVKQIRSFGPKVESRVKLDGKVIAVKTEMGDRTAYGLIYIVNHYGTNGENGYLKIKIKVTGFSPLNNGMPDGGVYSNLQN